MIISKKTKIRFLWILLSFFSMLLTIKGSTNNCFLHMDKSFYVVGETVWYQLYLSPAFKDKSIYIEVSISDQQAQVIHRSFLKSMGKTAINGYYKIPFNLTSEHYLIEFSSIDKNSNRSTVFVQATLPIFNDLEVTSAPIPLTDSSINKTINPPFESDLSIAIELRKNTYEEKELVFPTIKVTDQFGNPVNANLSISVVDLDLVGEDLVHFGNLRFGNTIDQQLIDNFDSQIYLRGIVKGASNKPQADKILGAYVKNEDKIIYARSDNYGKFKIALPDFYGSKNLQIIGEDTDNEPIRVEKHHNSPNGKITSTSINDKVANYLTLSRQRKKIYQEYSTTESPLILKKYSPKRINAVPDATYITKDYQAFEYMSIFFKENLTPLRFRLKDSLYIADMYNPRNQSYYKFFEGKPLIIIDNLVTRNGDFLARMRMADIEKVELFYELDKLNKQFKLFGSSGVTKISTYEKLENLPVAEAKNILSLNGLQAEANFPTFDPTSKQHNTSLPYFRPQIYWNPNLTTSNTGGVRFYYYQTNDRSTFQIRVIAQSENGAIGYATLNYQVQ